LVSTKSKGQKMLDQKKTSGTIEFDRFLTVAQMWLDNKITQDEFVGLITMLNTSVAEDFIAKVGK